MHGMHILYALYRIARPDGPRRFRPSSAPRNAMKGCAMNQPFAFNKGKPITTERAGVTVTKTGVYLGAEISGVDLRRPLSDAQFEAIEAALVEHELIIFHNQDITSDSLMSFGRRFNDLTVHPFA